MKWWWPWVWVTALTRVAAFCFTENLYGDSVVRTWLGYLWVQTPHVIGSFDQGGYQYGPLHVYLVGLATLLPWPMADSARLVSLLAGIVTVWPLRRLTASLFDDRAATLTCAAWAFWGLHIQFSTTTSAEALNLMLVVTCLWWLQRWFETHARVWLLGAALMLNLACATRYDSWLYVPLLTLAVYGRARKLRSAALFGAASMAFALPWMFGNFVDRGSPLFPFAYIDEFHRHWFRSEQAIWGSHYKWITTFFWPGSAVMTLTPLIALFGFIGCVRAWGAKPSSRWLIGLIVIPTVMYTVRSTVFLSFVPLARFTAKEVALLLPFVGVGAGVTSTWLKPRVFRLVMTLALGCMVVWPVWLSWFTYRTDGSWQNTLRAISPVTTNSPRLMQVARWLETVASDGSVVIIDLDPRGYDDLQLSFYSGFAFEKVARLRSPLFERRLQDGPVKWLVRFEGGALDTTHQFVNDTFRGMQFDEIAGFPPPFHVYAARLRCLLKRGHGPSAQHSLIGL